MVNHRQDVDLVLPEVLLDYFKIECRSPRETQLKQSCPDPTKPILEFEFSMANVASGDGGATIVWRTMARGEDWPGPERMLPASSPEVLALALSGREC